jgi:hypothetical protein
MFCVRRRSWRSVNRNVGDYDAWKPMFDQDMPRTREKAKGYRLYRNVDARAEVFIQIEFDSLNDAKEARERLLSSGVLERFDDKSGPTVVELTGTVT